MPVREVRSAERRVEVAERSADAAATAAAAASDPVLPDADAKARVLGAVAASSAIYPVTGRRRRSGLLIAAALTGAATLGGVISLAREPAPAGSNPAPVDRARTTAPLEPITRGMGPSAPARSIPGEVPAPAPARPDNDDTRPSTAAGSRPGDPSPGVPAQPGSGDTQVAAPAQPSAGPAAGSAGSRSSPGDSVPPTRQTDRIDQSAPRPGTPRPSRSAPTPARTDKPGDNAAKQAKPVVAPRDDHAAKPPPQCNVFDQSHASNACPK